MNEETWQTVLVACLIGNAIIGFGYRLYRMFRGGPTADAIGQALLGVLLVALGISIAAGWSAGRWVALGYGLFFAVVVMPVWTLAVLIPMRPDRGDVGFAATYWLALGVIAVAALLA